MNVSIKNRFNSKVEILGKLLSKDGVELYAIREGDKKGFGVSLDGEVNEAVVFDAVTLLGAMEFQKAKTSHASHVEFFEAMFDATICKVK